MSAGKAALASIAGPLSINRHDGTHSRGRSPIKKKKRKKKKGEERRKRKGGKGRERSFFFLLVLLLLASLRLLLCACHGGKVAKEQYREFTEANYISVGLALVCIGV